MWIRRPLQVASAVSLLLFSVVGLGFGCATAKNECEFNSDCANGYCWRADPEQTTGECREDCVDSARDCPTGFVCNANAQCERSQGGGGGGGSGGSSVSSSASTGSGGAGGDGATSSSSSSASSTSSSSASSSSTSSSSSTGGGTGTSLQLDICGSDAECSSGLICRPESMGGIKRCTTACATRSDCAVAGDQCATVDGGSGAESYCARSDVGKGCVSSSNCSSLRCTVPGYCSDVCANASDCPSGFGCMPVGGQRICVKVSEVCGAPVGNSRCIVDAACNEDFGETYVSGCTLGCSSASDCPQRALGLAPWTCSSGVCLRPSDVFGPVAGREPTEYYCDGGKVINLCNDAQHIDFYQGIIPSPPPVDCGSGTSTTGNAGDTCVDSCRYKGGCGDGLACVAQGSVDGNATRIGLCFPVGVGEVGATCTSNPECAFGYCLKSGSVGKCSRDCTADGLCPSGSTCTSVAGPKVGGQTFRRCE